MTTRIHIKVPEHLLKRALPLPFNPETPAHAKEPETLALHRMLGFAEQEQGRVLTVTQDEGRYRAYISDGDGRHEVRVPFFQLVAALSYLEGDVLEDTLRFVKSARGEVPHAIVTGVLTSAQRRILNLWDGTDEEYPWAGVGIIIVSNDGEEFVFARKDHRHPRMGYCGRLSLIGGNIDPHEILSAWGDQRACAFVGMLRECFEEIRFVDIAHEIASAAVYTGPARANCYLYEDSGVMTSGLVRPFVSQAPNASAWRRWRRIFTEVDGLSEAQPEILTREGLTAAIAEDSELARQRKLYLKTAGGYAANEAERELLERFSWKRIEARVRREMDLPDDELANIATQIWSEERERALRDGLFPLRHRGPFNFISGHAGPVAHALQYVDLL